MAIPLQGVNYNDSANIDAFNRLRVSAGKTLFESTFQYSLKRAFWWQQIVGTSTITHDPARSSANLKTLANNDIAMLQTKAYIPYEPGKSQLIKMTFVANAGPATKEIGYFDDNDGIFLRLANVHKPYFVLRSSVPSGTILQGNPQVVVETVVAKEQWNIDRLDGSGPSGILLDTSKQMILVIDLQFLGTGRLRVGFNIDGKIYYCHSFNNANINSVAPYMRTGTLPLRYRIKGVDATPDVLQAICAEVESEGGQDPLYYEFSAFNAIDVSLPNGVRTHLMSLKPKLLYGSSGLTNRMNILLNNIDVINLGSNSILIEVLYNTALTGPTWQNPNVLSAAEYSTTGTVNINAATPTDCGTIMTQSFFVAGNSGKLGSMTDHDVTTQFPITLTIDGTVGTIYSIVATALGGNSLARAASDWREIR